MSYFFEIEASNKKKPLKEKVDFIGNLNKKKGKQQVNDKLTINLLRKRITC